MAGNTVTRADLCDAVCEVSGVPRHEAAALVEQVLSEIGDAFARGENVKLSGFGTFTVRQKAERMDRNPKTGVEVPIEPRRAITFSPSDVLKDHVNSNGNVQWHSGYRPFSRCMLEAARLDPSLLGSELYRVCCAPTACE
jgi:integration host factor subunit alpha